MIATSTGPGRVRRAVYAGLGCGCVALGAIGAVVPGLPTTVFLLVASYLFARSSPRLDRRLREHPLFGASLRRFAETGGMPRQAKVVALASVGATAQAATVMLGLVGTASELFWVRTVPEAGRPA